MPKKPSGVQPYAIWIVSLCFVLFQFFIQLSSGQIIAGLMKSFTLTAFGAGLMASAYYYIYVTLQTPAGVLMGRYGPRKLLTAGAFVLMCGCLVFASTHSLVLAFLGRMVMGLGAAFAFVGTMYLIDKWFPRERFAFMVGIVEMAGMFGTLIGVFGLAHYVLIVGWRYCVYVAAIISGVLCVLLFLIVRDMPANRRPSLVKQPKRRILPGLLVLVRMKMAWINGIYSGTMFVLVTVLGALWGVPYLEEAHHLSLSESTFYCSLIYMGVGISMPILGWLDSKVEHRHYLASGLAALAFVSVLIIILFPALPLFFLGLCMFLAGVAASSYMLAFAVANELVAMRIRSASIGFINTLSVGGAPIFQPLVGLILYLLAKHYHPLEMKHYTTREFQIALMIVPLCLMVAIWLGWQIPSRRKKQ